MKKVFYFPLFKDWLFYFSIANLINLLSSILQITSDPLITDYTVVISQTFLNYILLWGVPLYVRFKLKQRNSNKEIIDSNENLIFVSFSTDDRLIVNKVIAELKEKVTLNIWMQEHIHGGHDGSEVIKNTINDSVGALVFFSNNSLQSSFINETEIPLIKQKLSDDSKYFVIPLRVSKTDPEFLDEFSELQTIPSKSQTITRSNSIEFTEIVNKISSSIPDHAKFKKTSHKQSDVSKILTFLGWVVTAFILTATVLPQNQLNNLFDLFSNDSYKEYNEYTITSDPEIDICTLWLQDGKQRLDYQEALFELLNKTYSIDEEIQLREEVLNRYKVYLFDMQRVADFHAEQSYEYISVANAIDSYIKITLEQLSTQSYYSGDSLENREKSLLLYENMVENEVIVSKFCFDNGFEVSPTSLMSAKERRELLEDLMQIEP